MERLAYRRERDSVFVARLVRAPSTRLRPLPAASMPPFPPSGRRGLRIESQAITDSVEKSGKHSRLTGERGIRTLGTLTGSTVFETVRFNRSRISPKKHEAERIRTSDLQIRNLMLYPAELQPRQKGTKHRRLVVAFHGAGGIRSSSRASCALLRPASALFRRHPAASSSLRSARASFRIPNVKPKLWNQRLFVAFHGAGGIRTPGTLLGHNSLAGSPIRPLSHRSSHTVPDRIGGFGLRRAPRARSFDPPPPSSGSIPAASSSLRSARVSFRIPNVKPKQKNRRPSAALAEQGGFEPPEPSRVQRFSRPPP